MYPMFEANNLPVPSHEHEESGQSSPSPVTAAGSAGGTDYVVLVHGLASHRILLSTLARRLRNAGFTTENWGYESLLRPIEKPAEQLRQRLIALNERPYLRHIHIVAHSMGTVLARYALSTTKLPKVHRLVMLAPPNKGSPVARYVAKWLARLSPPIAQLSDDPESWVRNLSDVPPDVQVGIIAARFDLLVPLEATQLDRPVPRVIVDATHTGMLFSKEVAQQVITFLQTGHFNSTECAA